jgi:hypothetical protein
VHCGDVHVILYWQLHEHMVECACTDSTFLQRCADCSNKITRFLKKDLFETKISRSFTGHKASGVFLLFNVTKWNKNAIGPLFITGWQEILHILPTQCSIMRPQAQTPMNVPIMNVKQVSPYVLVYSYRSSLMYLIPAKLRVPVESEIQHDIVVAT